MRSHIGLLAIGVSAALGCASGPAPLTETDRAAIRELMDAVERHITVEDHAAWANSYIETGVFHIANVPPQRGRAEDRSVTRQCTRRARPFQRKR